MSQTHSPAASCTTSHKQPQLAIVLDHSGSTRTKEVIGQTIAVESLFDKLTEQAARRISVYTVHETRIKTLVPADSAPEPPIQTLRALHGNSHGGTPLSDAFDDIQRSTFTTVTPSETAVLLVGDLMCSNPPELTGQLKQWPAPVGGILADCDADKEELPVSSKLFATTARDPLETLDETLLTTVQELLIDADTSREQSQ